MLRVQIPEGEYSQLRLVVRVARLCSGATVGFQNIGEATLTERIVATFERVATLSIAAHPVTQPVDCSARS